MSNTKSVCVYCGSRHGAMPDYEASAAALGQAIADQNWRLVYGAGDVGLMGTVARRAQSAGADVFGVIPVHLLDQEVGKTDLARFVITETMHERKKVMLMNADAVVLLPGGAGSLEEFFEALTWAQLELHAKPIIILNIAGYWDPLVALIDRTVAQGFADPSLKELFVVAVSVKEAVERLRAAFC